MEGTLWIIQFLLGVLHIILPAEATRDTLKFPLLHQPDPFFIPTQNNVTVRAGDLAILPCSIRHLGTKQVAWRRLGEDYFMTIGSLTWVRDQRVLIEHKQREGQVSDWNLLIKNVSAYYSGIYECQITATEKLKQNVRLNVIGPPLRHPGITLHGKRYVDMGERIRLTCNATGGPQIPEEIDWFKEGDKIDSEKYGNIVITKYRSLKDQSLVSELIIDRSSTSDSGMYICRSSDKEIESRKVTVLVADSSNVKRGTGSSSPPDKSENGAGTIICWYGAQIWPMVMLTLSMLLPHWVI